MATDITDLVWRSRLGLEHPAAKIVLLRLADRVNQKKWRKLQVRWRRMRKQELTMSPRVFSSVRLTAEECEISHGAAARALRCLVDAGILIVRRRGVGTRASRFRINVASLSVPAIGTQGNSASVPVAGTLAEAVEDRPSVPSPESSVPAAVSSVPANGTEPDLEPDLEPQIKITGADAPAHMSAVKDHRRFASSESQPKPWRGAHHDAGLEDLMRVIRSAGGSRR